MAKLSDEDREILTAYLDGELDEEAARALEARLNLDPDARAEAEALQQAWSMLDYLPRPEPSASFTHRTMQRLAVAAQTGKAPRPWRLPRWASGLAWAAAVLVAVAAGLGASHFLWPAPAESEIDEQMVRHLRVVEKYRLYEQVDDIEFLRSLDDPDLFGAELGS